MNEQLNALEAKLMEHGILSTVEHPGHIQIELPGDVIMNVGTIDGFWGFDLSRDGATIEPTGAVQRRWNPLRTIAPAAVSVDSLGQIIDDTVAALYADECARAANDLIEALCPVIIERSPESLQAVVDTIATLKHARLIEETLDRAIEIANHGFATGIWGAQDTSDSGRLLILLAIVLQMRGVDLTTNIRLLSWLERVQAINLSLTDTDDRDAMGGAQVDLLIRIWTLHLAKHEIVLSKLPFEVLTVLLDIDKPVIYPSGFYEKAAAYVAEHRPTFLPSQLGDIPF